MQTIVTRGLGQVQRIVTRGYGREVEEYIKEVIRKASAITKSILMRSPIDAD